MITSAKYYFLSRPRRFGKSLFLDTLSEIFKGSKELFEGLFIYDKWDWTETFPVIKINFAIGDFSTKESIKKRVASILVQNCEELGVDYKLCENDDLGTYLEQTIRLISKTLDKKVVVLVDEYDKPILDNIHKEDKTVALAAREVLRNFYSAIKGSDQYLKFVFLTGVSKFSKLNLFSGLNNIQDITLHKNYTTITGYTHKDLIDTFSDYTVDVDLEEVRRWYDGYNYLGEPVYNPYDILLFFSNGNEFENYWWETGNPSFLVEKLKARPSFLPDLETKLVNKEMLNAFDVEHIGLTALLWQTGYLTFDEKLGDGGDVFYRMKVPNLEIQKSLNYLFFNYLSGLEYKETDFAYATRLALNSGDMDKFRQAIHGVFSAIPYHNYANNPMANYEGYYASVIYSFLSSLSFAVVAEDTTNHGRIDMTMVGRDSIFIIEFKVDMPAEDALQQIKDKRYYEKYQNQEKPIYMIGMQFDSELKNIREFKYEILPTE